MKEGAARKATAKPKNPEPRMRMMWRTVSVIGNMEEGYQVKAR
jgi:hypothetical protein